MTMNKIVICFILTIAGTSQCLENDSIESFIKKLLESRKFNELTDIIAEKAVDKIIEYTKSNNTKLDPMFRTSDSEEHVNSTNVASKHVNLRNLGNITVPSLRNLGLRLQHFKKGLQNDTRKTKDKAQERNKSVLSQSNEQFRASEATEESSEESDITHSNNSEDREVNEKTTPKTKKKDKKEKKVINTEKKKKHEAKSKEDKGKSGENETDGMNNSIKSQELEKTTPPIKATEKKHRKHKKEKSTTKRAKIMRREGDKVFTFDSASDYNDYHELLEKSIVI